MIAQSWSLRPSAVMGSLVEAGALPAHVAAVGWGRGVLAATAA